MEDLCWWFIWEEEGSIDLNVHLGNMEIEMKALSKSKATIIAFEKVIFKTNPRTVLP